MIVRSSMVTTATCGCVRSTATGERPCSGRRRRESGPRPSRRDGRWIAYTSDKSGRHEIYVRAFPSGEAEHKVSLDGGMAARWRADGREIFFLSLDGTMMAARVDTARGFNAMMPESLFPTGLSLITLRPYAVAPDGRFLIPMAADAPGAAPITVTLNWQAKIPR